MYDEETGNQKLIDYERYQVICDDLEKAKKIISNHEEIVNGLITSISENIKELEKTIEDTKKELARITND